MSTKKSYPFAFAIVILTFFIWGFLTVLNDILVPYLQKVFELNDATSLLVQFAFFLAYFVGSLVYFSISISKGDPINKIGYKNGILIGLFIAMLGTLLFYPAAHYKIFILFLVALFVLALGITLLQIAANPYVSILGSEENASSRLNLAQAFNSLGTTLAPILGGYLIYTVFGSTGEPFTDLQGNPILTGDGNPISAQGIQIPYLIFGGILFLLMVIIYFTPLPNFTNSDVIKKDMGSLRHKNLVYGMIAIFFYVGAEVSIGSVLIKYLGLQEIMGLSEEEAKTFLAFYWGGAMIGRTLGAISLSQKTRIPKLILMPLTSLGIFLLIYGFVYLEKGASITEFLPFVGFLILNLVGFVLGKSKAHKSLMVFAFVVIGLLVTTSFSSGQVALWSIIGVGIFNSIMWSNIFTLAIKDLKEYTSQGSSLLIMAIIGGALLPLAQGSLIAYVGIQLSFLLPTLSYAYLMWYGWKGYKPGLFKK